MSDLNQDTIAFIEDLVLYTYMANNRSFTSLDIANEAKDRGFFARNRHVAEWLRSNAIRVAYEHSFLYNQTLIRVNSKAAGMTLAYLYHHMSVDPDTYLDRDQNPKPFRKAAPTPNPAYLTPNIVGGSGSSRKDVHHSNFQQRDGLGRFC